MLRGKIIVCICVGLLSSFASFGQEVIVPISKGHTPPNVRKHVDTLFVHLPFVDDFSNYEGVPDPSLWLTNDAYVNKDYDPYPPTIGMVTLDAIDVTGDLHYGASTGIFSADTLASQFIRLDSVFSPSRRPMQIADSIRLTFYYLPGGGSGNLWQRIGDCPEESDSLFLEFYNPVQSRWDIVWSTGGICVDSLVAHSGKRWQFVNIPILNSEYLSSRFQFRFRNYCSLDANPKTGMVGNCDHWNVDYVKLGTGRSHNEIYARDVAFVQKAPSLLERYQAIPAKQYSASSMTSDIDIVITNLYSQVLTTSYSFDIIDGDGNSIYHYDGGHENAPSFLPNGTYQTANAHANPSLAGFSYPVSINSPAVYNIVHVLKEGSAGDSRRSNDTMTFSQVFDNYYAYDDGSPENGYGITSPSSKISLACRYDLNVQDTLTAVDLYFNRTREDENVFLPFYLCVWDVADGKPGQLIYKDTKKLYSSKDSLNQFVRYRLSEPLLIHGSVFVGLEQGSNDYLNLGFDRNNDASQYIYYRTSSDWQRSILSGSLMMRPYFGYRALLDVNVPKKGGDLKIFPNPTSNILNINFPQQSAKACLLIYDSKGRVVYSGQLLSQLDVHSYPPGVYLLRIIDNGSGTQANTKLIITH